MFTRRFYLKNDYSSIFDLVRESKEHVIGLNAVTNKEEKYQKEDVVLVRTRFTPSQRVS